MKKGETYIHFETGEKIEGIARLTTVQEELEQMKTKERQVKRLKAKKEYRKKALAGTTLSYTFNFMQHLKEVSKELIEDKQVKGTYLGHFLYLQRYMNYEGVLYKNKQSRHPLKRTEIYALLGINSKSTGSRFIKALIDKGLLFEVVTDKGEGFKVNGRYAFKGKGNARDTVKVFNETMSTLFDENTASDLSFMYLLLPYVNEETNIICWNVNETDPSEINALSLEDIATVTGLSTERARKKLSSIKYNGLYAVLKVTKGRGSFYKVNPFLYYRQYGEPDESLKADFLVKGK